VYAAFKDGPWNKRNQLLHLSKLYIRRRKRRRRMIITANSIRKAV
jgi:hypothetical protein